MLGHIPRHFVEIIQPQIGETLFALLTVSSFSLFHSLYLHANQSPHNSLFLKLYSECFHSNICRPLPWSSLLVCVFFPGLGRAFLAQKIGTSSYHMLQKCWTLVLMWGKPVSILTASLIFLKKTLTSGKNQSHSLVDLK